MVDEITIRQRETALTVVQKVELQDRAALVKWLEALLEIRDKDASPLHKARLSISATLSSSVVWPMIKTVAKYTKKFGWSDRGWTARVVVIASGAGLAVFGGQNAGIAALGGAIGVPLWVVLGGGAAFANLLREELLRSMACGSESKTSYTIVEAEKVPHNGTRTGPI